MPRGGDILLFGSFYGNRQPSTLFAMVTAIFEVLPDCHRLCNPSLLVIVHRFCMVVLPLQASCTDCALEGDGGHNAQHDHAKSLCRKRRIRGQTSVSSSIYTSGHNAQHDHHFYMVVLQLQVGCTNCALEGNGVHNAQHDHAKSLSRKASGVS